jgi:hypothetical protein
MQLPLQILQLGELRVNRFERTRDISSSGVRFLSATEVEVGGRIEYVITLSGSNPPVKIRCLGKVIRSTKPPAGESLEGADRDPGDEEKFEIAVTMERYQFVREDELQALAVNA